MSFELFVPYLLACLVIVLVPGPSVTMILANSLRHGTRAGLETVAGSQFGLAASIIVVGIGLTSLIETMGHWFEWLRLIGAAYLVWLGVRMLRAPLAGDGAVAPTTPRGGFVLQGGLVALSNPKTLVFFGAFLPQFVDPRADHLSQIAIMGLTFLAIAGTTDSIYAMMAGRAAAWLSRRRARMVSRVSGGILIGGGAWLALARIR
jgi:homoserine/homoserine lactone efflux protein